jgi:hypothetical protein
MAADPGFPALRRKPLAARPRDDDIHAIAAPSKETTMSQTLTQRLLSLTLASIFSLAIVGSVSGLFVGVEAQQANLAQHSTPAAPRA